MKTESWDRERLSIVPLGSLGSFIGEVWDGLSEEVTPELKPRWQVEASMTSHEGVVNRGTVTGLGFGWRSLQQMDDIGLCRPPRSLSFFLSADRRHWISVTFWRDHSVFCVCFVVVQVWHDRDVEQGGRRGNARSGLVSESTSESKGGKRDRGIKDDPQVLVWATKEVVIPLTCDGRTWRRFNKLLNPEKTKKRVNYDYSPNVCKVI